MIKNSHQSSVISHQSKKIGYHLLILISLLFTVHCYAEELPTLITSDFLEYEKETSIYTAKGSVMVQRGDAVIEAIEMRYNEKTSDVVAEGDVRYNDLEVFIKAKRAELNLDTKKGRLYDAEIFTKRDNYHISGTEIEKKGEKEYFLTKASFTTCDAPLPAWCFKGRDVDVVLGDRLKAKDVTFQIKGLPVLYTPYLWAPIHTERKTGFLMPVIGYSKTKGFHFGPAFFWAIAENRDATFVLDVYSKRGVGEGVEYRYIEKENVRGNLWLYHLRDNWLNKDFYELRSLHEQRKENGLSAYLNLNLLNERDFYREYSRDRDERTKRFLESTGEVSFPLNNSRLYLMSQYLIDLKESTDASTTPQRLPEAGFVVNPSRIGPVVFSLSSSASNFWRDKGVYGQRFDIYPKISHSSGDSIIFFQSLGLRETAYLLHRGNDFGSSPHRETFDYNVSAGMRLLKNYSTVTHIIEPSIGYTFIPLTESNLPLFDSTEVFTKTSTVKLSILNRLLDREGEFLAMRLTQAFDSYKGDRPFLPFTIEATLQRPIYFKANAAYDVHKGELQSVNSEFRLKAYEVTFSFGERYQRDSKIMFYDAGVEFSPLKTLSIESRLWYDAKGGGVRDITLKARYTRQCWGLTMTFVKKPDDFRFFIMFDLLGLSSLKV